MSEIHELSLENLDKPIEIYHRNCGKFLFYYFGSIQEAGALQNPEKLMSDTYGSVAEPYYMCHSCGCLLKKDDLEVSIQFNYYCISEYKLTNTNLHYYVDEKSVNKIYDAYLNNILNMKLYNDPT